MLFFILLLIKFWLPLYLSMSSNMKMVESIFVIGKSTYQLAYQSTGVYKEIKLEASTYQKITGENDIIEPLKFNDWDA